MIPGMNPRKMQQMMRKMGISQQEIDATEVIIKTAEKELVISNPQVSKVNMMGQETFHIIGNVEERSREIDISDEDIRTVMEQANADKKSAKEAIEKNNGDLAAAIMELKSD